MQVGVMLTVQGLRDKLPSPSPGVAPSSAINVDEALQAQALSHAAAVKAQPPPPYAHARFLCNSCSLLQALSSQHTAIVEELHAAAKRADQAHAAEADRLNAEVWRAAAVAGWQSATLRL